MSFLGSDNMVSISIVSHHQCDIVSQLLCDINLHCKNSTIEIILTLNVPEALSFNVSDFRFPIRIINNCSPIGFGANHNQAFKISKGDFFCILNPDIRISSCPFDILLTGLGGPLAGVIAPKILGHSGLVEDSARRFPTFKKILRKLFSRHWKSDYALVGKLVDVDWVGGMFMVFSRTVFARMEGFNECYFLYYEDVDLCARLNLAGLRVIVDPSVHVVHHAQHTSHRSLKYLRWHVGSLLRFLNSSEYRQLKRQNRL
jgi:GT2 family glycosyltransferase